MADLDYVGKWTINFGRFKGTTYEVMLGTEEGRGYCEWLLRNCAIRNAKVKAYIQQRLATSS